MISRPFIALGCLCVAAMTACKKKDNSQAEFAQRLKSTCTAPFVGKGDTAKVYFPTAFTPNGDGINDVYGSVFNTTSFTSVTLNIYDTTGTLVHLGTATSGYFWDGFDKNTGKVAAKYKYYIKIRYTTAGNVTDSGSTYVYVLTTDASRHCINRVPADSGRYQFPTQFIAGAGFSSSVDAFETYCN